MPPTTLPKLLDTALNETAIAHKIMFSVLCFFCYVYVH